ncbi:probable cytochrome P450 301a1, mitochondrial [Neocloeon triangulifer]|uniref:probable cytochrome P450 301a1, mitochondrial n=1 Tax=Neocloeon triangulifer TaxID=2078957 RepID=UPI00286F272F|nr:probable cytochrome P450 301a1, mitochondrial [Neocloeon triangulifer]
MLSLRNGSSTLNDAILRVVRHNFLAVRLQSHISVAPEVALEEIISERSSSVKPYSEVPGPRPLPLIGNTWRVLPYIGQYAVSDLARVSKIFNEKYGKVVKLSGLVGRPDLLFVFDCDEIEKVYRQEGPTPYRPSMPCLVQYKSKVRRDFFGDLPGVVGVHGEPWREFRTKVQKPILQPKIVKQYIKPIEQVTDDFINRMLTLRDTNLELPGDFDNEIHKWSLECIGRVALDVRLGCLDARNSGENSEPQKIIDAAKFALRNVAVLELKMPFWRYLPASALWNRYVKNMDFFREVCMKYIDEAMERLRNKDPDNPNNELSLVERILADEPDPKTAYILALDLILVGIDTISMAVASILYQVATRPEEQEKLYQEVKKVLPDKNATLTAQDLENMPYQRAFVKEVLRKYSTVIGNGRTLMKDMVIGGYHIPKGVQLVFPTIVTGNMEEYVSDASSFKPERWLNKQQCPVHTDKIHPFASLPYGYGARMCLGRRFADLEIQVLLAKLLRSYKLEFNHDPLDYQVTFMYAPDGKLQFKMTERND